MVKSLRFLFNFVCVNLGAIFGFAVIIIGGCYATGIADNPARSNLFETYYAMFPTMVLLCLFLYAFGLCTNNLNMALSMGARRVDFFWALQGIMVFYTVVCWALEWFMSIFPALANWEVRERWNILSTYSGKLWTFPALCFVLLVLGCLSGLVMVKSKVLGGLIITLSVVIMMAATVFLLLSVETDLVHFPNGKVWGDLPMILTAVLAVCTVGGEFLIWRTIRRYVVR